MDDAPATDCLDRRRACVLLHLTSLPGGGPCGDLGPEAYHFVSFLADCGVTVWQMLPVGPPQIGDSPYQTSSAHAGSPRLIGLEPLAEAGWISGELPADLSDASKRALLLAAYKGFQRSATDQDRAALDAFCEAQRFWLEDYALYRAIHEERETPWWEWPKGLRDRDGRSLGQARRRLAKQLGYIRFEQFLFFRQWDALRAFANERGVRLFGDMPIFVAHDSAEVWARPGDFDLNPDGSCRVVAGVPPDYFSATGQRWGNPLYRWDQLKKNGFRFWLDRMRTQLRLFDMIRIDHFRGFEAYWEVPAEEDTALNGSWVKAEGDALFAQLKQELGALPLIAEDLGVITDEVDALRRKYRMPGMKVLQFAFEGGPDNPYLPFHHSRDSVTYTGTHDNDTTLGWYEALDAGLRAHVDDYLGHSQEPMPWPMIRAALASRADLAVVPMQDLMGLGGAHRMNRPGVAIGNWQWRFQWDELDDALPARFAHLVELYGRRPG
ncbi:MAG: 4-alpha-glucanotransferase [Gammaproteobacteria bacterium]|jgi:4-alpha-glucanotransferase|nr:4-alpha-glucanotransferase [Gammaproteobacteria bacterium]